MQKSSAHAWHFNTHRNENTKISVSTPCWQYWVNLSEAKKIRKTKTFKYMKYSSICTQNSNSKIADNIELGIMLNCTQFMIEVGICALKNVPLFAFSSSAVFFLLMCDMYIKLVSNPINHFWEILAVKNGLRFCICGADILFFGVPWWRCGLWIAKNFQWKHSMPSSYAIEYFQNCSLYIVICLDPRDF